jgi:hypothetical protein
MSDLSSREAEVVREFAAALRQAREEETERMRNVLYGLELLGDGLADLIAEMRRENAAAVTANSFDGRRPLAHVQPSSFRLQM